MDRAEERIIAETEAAATRRSVRLQKRRENGQKGKVTKDQLVLEGVAKTSVLIRTCEKVVEAQPSPLLHLRWGSSEEDVGAKMIGKEQNCRRSKSFTQKHPRIQPRMRSVLLDWLIEVSEAYALHRQTFYLAQDYFDRFMLTQANIEKGTLQLIYSIQDGASPPKVSQMAYMTAGTCCEEEILQMELIILKALGWNLCPETAVSWLKLYFQTASMNKNIDLLTPQFPRDVYVQMTHLLDLCILHINSLDFQHRVLAAAVLSHFVQQETVEKVSGLSKDATQPCVKWTAPFVDAVSRFGRAAPKEFARVKMEEDHNIQTHTDYMNMLEHVSKKEVNNNQLLTPPNSTEKACT